MNEEWWLEVMEKEKDKESDPATRRDLEFLLENSSTDRAALRRWQALRDLVASSDDVVVPEDGRVYDRMHDRIMSAIEDGESDRIASQATGASWLTLLTAFSLPAKTK